LGNSASSAPCALPSLIRLGLQSEFAGTTAIVRLLNVQRATSFPAMRAVIEPIGSQVSSSSLSSSVALSMLPTWNRRTPTIMGISPAKPESHQMSDVTMARSYLEHIGGSTPPSQLLNKAYIALAQLNPKWTHRRVRAIWHREAAAVEYREMIELHRAAEKEVAERAKLAAARKEHADFIEKTARLRALLEHQDSDFHSPEIERLRRVAGGMDRPRAGRGG